MKIEVFGGADEAGRVLAREIADGIEDARRANRRYLLGCPGGRSPLPTYRALADEVRQRDLDIRHLVLVMMDEYVVTAEGEFTEVPVISHCSLRRFATQEVFDRLNAAASQGKEIPTNQLWIPDPRATDDYDKALEAAGGIDLFILASGATDGHVAFNPPGTSSESKTRVVQLAETTRRDNLMTFPGFANIQEVPRHGVTIGIATIASLSLRAVLVANGQDKQLAVARVAAAKSYEPDWPSTVLAVCRQAAIYADEEAAALISQSTEVRG
ncbi:6-phosphogluconolactonase [Rhizobium miluonense]|uniref:Glucosamine-6-phosphate deaminase n=1 Tax=Rhizobium miluonense TaxID=411945 RepID=A0A1C3V758_9HYPH|nr:6-phosphogluconolactonase [Rhizobium miluonense]SCB23563.1 glucosamine-6-phosphate deaminase [Rhizobium miluonense]